jgi:hypothetical protein
MMQNQQPATMPMAASWYVQKLQTLNKKLSKSAPSFQEGYYRDLSTLALRAGNAPLSAQMWAKAEVAYKKDPGQSSPLSAIIALRQQKKLPEAYKRMETYLNASNTRQSADYEEIIRLAEAFYVKGDKTGAQKTLGLIYAHIPENGGDVAIPFAVKQKQWGLLADAKKTLDAAERSMDSESYSVRDTTLFARAWFEILGDRAQAEKWLANAEGVTLDKDESAFDKATRLSELVATYRLLGKADKAGSLLGEVKKALNAVKPDDYLKRITPLWQADKAMALGFIPKIASAEMRNTAYVAIGEECVAQKQLPEARMALEKITIKDIASDSEYVIALAKLCQSLGDTVRLNLVLTQQLQGIAKADAEKREEYLLSFFWEIAPISPSFAYAILPRFKTEENQRSAYGTLGVVVTEKK